MADIDPSTIVDRETVSVPLPGGKEAVARTFEIIRTTQRDPYHTDTTEAAKKHDPGDTFGPNHDRGVAKIKILRGKAEEFEHLGALLDSLPSKAAMVKHVPPLSRDTDFDRVKEEKRNVRVRAFLWAATRESDNDYHVILGRADRKPTRFMNVEISGLPAPATADSPRLRKVRTTFEDMVRPTRLGLPGSGGYDFYIPPFPVIVEGSLFFDITHANDGGPGPKDAKPASIWEIHPVSRLEFIDDGKQHDSAHHLDRETVVETAELPSTDGTPRKVVRTTQRDPYNEE